jgi:hypothetical protein
VNLLRIIPSQTTAPTLRIGWTHLKFSDFLKGITQCLWLSFTAVMSPKRARILIETVRFETAASLRQGTPGKAAAILGRKSEHILLAQSSKSRDDGPHRPDFACPQCRGDVPRNAQPDAGRHAPLLLAHQISWLVVDTNLS